MIWFREYHVQEPNGRPQNHLGALLGIEFMEIGEDFLVARMPVNEKTHQPYGILHGGASVVLAETKSKITP